ncbi:MAG TPA: SMP-30/gluconolactonase/LRE family protein [Solirubrobacteraceae bacterium]|nr:SMP-30/gluconolactonase/LRE family protein [Solirubrobacteraceae bacterium]
MLSCLGLIAWASAAKADPTPSSPSALTTEASPLSGPLAVSGAPTAPEQIRAQQEAHRQTPEAFAAREASQSAYQHLDSNHAKELARSAFPRLIEEPAGGPPALPTGEKITSYESDYTAQVDLPEHRHGVVESVAPIALQTTPDHRTPVDLQIHEAAGAFQPVTPVVALTIPKHLSDGTQLGRTGISLTPTTSSGSDLAGSEGEVDGTGVIYPNTLEDADTLVKPTTLGFSMETLLRSSQSPRQLYFRVNIPSGAQLEAATDGSGGAEVLENGASIATIAAPSAEDAEGTPVPVTMAVSGGRLTLTLPESTSQYRLPITVDPTVEDHIWQNEYYYSTYYRTEWTFEHNGPYFEAPEHPEKGSWTENISGKHGENELGGLFYVTRGASQILVGSVEGEWSDTNNHIQNYVLLQVPKSPYTEAYDPLPVATEAGRGGGGVACAPSLNCTESTAGSAPPENSNEAGYEQIATGIGTGYKSYNKVTKAYVDISQEQGPELSFNTTAPEIKNRATGEEVPNVLYGSGAWLGPHSGAFEVNAKDPGLGLKYYRVLTSGWGDYKEYYGAGECFGVQCPEYNNQPYIYETGMHDGGTSFEAFIEDSVGLYADIYPQKIKVDATPPHGIKVSGFQNGSELPLGETHLKVEATDGTEPTPSSGIKSITVKVDGQEVSGSAASCPLGPCTASTELTLAARNYSSGAHSLVVTATDNANNVAQEEFTFYVHGAAPVSVGPGSVDPSTGELTLQATDVSPSGGVGVSRTYKSRALSAGAEGPLGPQWSLDLGGDEQLAISLNGDAVLSASGGAPTTFIHRTGGEYESPSGDANLKLEAGECKPGKGAAYILQDEKAGTKTCFEQPSGTQSAAPSFATQFGEAPNQLNHPVSVAIDPSGNLWVINGQTDQIEKFSSTGTLLASYGSYGTGAGQFNAPWGVAVDPRTGNVYVSDQANDRIEELSSSGVFIKAFGWGVSDGHAEFESCIKECRAGIAGSGSGQFSGLAGLAVDASGNVWVADFGNNRIQEFNEKSEFVRKFGSAGTGSEQFEGPLNITLSGGNLYITDSRNNRIQEFTTTGSALIGFGECTGGPGHFSDPYGIATDPHNGNLYVVDNGNTRVQECTTSRGFVTKFGSAGSGPGQLTAPTGVAVSASGGIYVVDYNTNRVEEWTRPIWVPAEVGGPLASSGASTFAYAAVEGEGKVVIEPTEALAPVPAGVSCGTKAAELARGCRALTFNYAASTTATGEKESEWGDYKGNLTRVYYHAWDSAKGAMSEVEVAHYLFDSKGRLRAEWDPRISPALKTTYGYDGEEHLTALDPPGQEPWLFSYGMIEGDESTGRLLAVTRPSASTALGGGEAPEATTAPALSTSKPEVGKAVSVNNGSWSGSPLAYSYQWYSGWAEVVKSVIRHRCERIQGAVNATYTPLTRDYGRRLYAGITAYNRAGATVKVTSPSPCEFRGVIVGGSGELTTEPLPPAPEVGSDSVATLEYRVPTSGTGLQSLTTSEAAKWGQTDDPVEGVAIFPADEPMGWPAKDYKRATIHYWDANGRMVNTALPTGGIATSEYNKTNDVVRTLSADNRAAALGEGAKSAEVSKLLDTESAYSSNGTQLIETRGPQHTAKLASGATVQARNHVRYFYDEGASGGQTYNLLTKTTDGAEYEGKEADVRTTLSSYSGQENLGWKLRKPTSTTTDPSGLDLVHKTTYDPNTGNIVETSTPAANSETIYPFAFSAAFGSEGAGSGQFKTPAGSATDAAGDVWVVDEGNNRIEELSSSGAFVKMFGWGVSNGVAEFQTCTTSCRAGIAGSGNGQFQAPWGIAINQSTGNVYVADRGNNRIEELSSAGAFIAKFGTSGSGTLKEPTGDAIDSSGDVWVSDWGHNRLVEFNSEGNFIREAGSSGSGSGQINGPGGLVVSEASVFVADYYNNRIDQFSSTGASLGQFGSKGSGAGQFNGPYAVIANPSTGALYVADTYNHRIQELSPAGRFLTEWQTWGSSHQLSNPTGLAVGAAGKLYVSDLSGNQVSTWTPPEAGAAHLGYASQIGSKGSGNGQLSTPINTAIDGEGNIWVTDCGNDRVEKFSAKGSFIAAYGKEGSGEDQYHCPGGIDINQSTGNVYVADTYGARIEELSSSGSFVRSFGTEGAGKVMKPGSIKLDSAGDMWVPDMSADKVFEFSASGAYIASYGKEGSGEVQFKQPTAVAFSGGNLYVADSGNHRVQELSSTGAFIRQFGKEGGGGGELYDPEGIAADAAGNLYVVDAGASHVEEFTPSGGYIATFATKGSGEGQVKAPIGDAIDAAGDMYVVDTENNRVQKWSTEAVHDTKTVYYSVGANSEYPSCGSHPEWANMPCETLPVAQPNTPGIPNLPVSSVTYTMWSVPETITETFGSVTRTKKETFDAAGRALTSEVSSSTDTPLPKVTNEYNTQTGALEKQSTTSEGKTRTITSVDNKLGELEKYTDADGVTSTYTRDVDGRAEEVNYGTVDGATASQIYTYDTTTGTLDSLYDTAVGTFTAKYDLEAKMTSETYPNGMTANYTRNQAGEAAGLEYVKTTHCASNCVWFSDAVTPSIHGEALKQSSTLAEQSIQTDAAGRLTQIQETLAGKGCTTRQYAYDEEGDRTSLTTHEPGSKGECTSEGGAHEAHLYDAANRLSDTGVSYDALGNVTALPAADAGGHELKSSYYVDNQVASQEQEQAGKAKTISFAYDPAGRTRETLATGQSAVISHYAGPGEALSWTSEGSAIWSRSIPGIDGTLCATQVSGQAPVLQLHDLQGNIVATASLSETETKLLSTYDSTEFGVPRAGTTAPKYAWLGAAGVSSELPSSGVVTTGAGSYVPEIGRALQSEAVASPGVFPDGTGGGGIVQATYWEAAAEQFKAIAVEHEAALEAAARREAEEKAHMEECPASECHVDGPGEGNFEGSPEPSEGGAEESDCEYGLETGQGPIGCGEDPEHHQFLTRGEAEETAFAFRVGGAALREEAEEVLGPVGALLVKLGTSYIDGIATNLELCAKLIGPPISGAARCELTLYTFKVPLIGLEVPYKVGVQTCIPYGTKLRCT